MSAVGWLLVFADAALLLVTALAGFHVARAASGGRIWAFEAALDDAREPHRLGDVATNLLPLTPDTTGLVWEEGPEPRRVLVATWTDHDYDRLVGACKLHEHTWVTPVPELQDRCREFGLAGDDLDRRVTQYLGLRPKTGHDSVVELWVEVGANSIFRPCPDPEVDDRECRTGLPEDSEDPAHSDWFYRQLGTYYGTSPYPWTRLGYTYDWGDPDWPVGASEYVVPSGTVVWVGSVTPTEQYCAADRQVSRRRPTAIPAELPGC